SRMVEEAQRLILGLQSPSGGTKTEADSLWQSISAHADGLTNTTRLEAPVSTYNFPAESTGFISGLPYFYGWSRTDSKLLRTGKGTTEAVQQQISLANSADSIVSMARSTEADGVFYALTKQSKVYRVVQTGNTTSL